MWTSYLASLMRLPISLILLLLGLQIQATLAAVHNLNRPAIPAAVPAATTTTSGSRTVLSSWTGGAVRTGDIGGGRMGITSTWTVWEVESRPPQKTTTSITVIRYTTSIITVITSRIGGLPATATVQTEVRSRTTTLDD